MDPSIASISSCPGPKSCDWPVIWRLLCANDDRIVRQTNPNMGVQVLILMPHAVDNFCEHAAAPQHPMRRNGLIETHRAPWHMARGDENRPPDASGLRFRAFCNDCDVWLQKKGGAQAS
jgi:hypothetical protein